jgi:hypothetical protein
MISASSDFAFSVARAASKAPAGLWQVRPETPYQTRLKEGRFLETPLHFTIS